MGKEIKDCPILAIVVPCYNEEEIIEKSFNIINALLQKLICEKVVSENSYISVVDDGSTDKSFEILKNLEKDNNLKLIKLSSNCGHQKALLSGLVQNEADIYISLDCDLQDDINVIPKMIELYKNNDIDVVYGVRKNRDVDTFFKKFSANLYYLLSKIFGVKGINNAADFRLISHNVVNLLKNVDERNLYLRGLIPSFNLKNEVVYYDRFARIGGSTKYTLKKMLKLALDGIISSISRR